MLEEFVGQKIVVDLRIPVCLGTLQRVDEHFLEHHTPTCTTCATPTRRGSGNAESHATGIKRNRKRLVLMRSEIVAVARLEDVVDD